MGITRLAARTSVRVHLDDTNAADYIWPNASIDAFLDEGLRSLAPVLLRENSVAREAAAVSSMAKPTDAVYVVRVYADNGSELPDWHDFGDDIRFDEPVLASLTIEYFGEWPVWAAGDASESPLRAYQDVVVSYYAIAKCYRELARDRVKFKRYSTIAQPNNVDIEDIVRLADMWEEDFLRAREAVRSPKQLRLERDLRGDLGGNSE